nr:PREDICTED: V-type proton ATPase subunit G 3 [Opisthocomus hoazin]
MTSQSQGIQQLLQAEKRAKDKLEEAKKSAAYALSHMLAVADSVHSVVELAEFRNKQTNVMGSHGNLSAKIEEQTTETIRNITSSYHKNMESMMKNILSTICDINPEVHPNFRNAV